MFQKISGIGNFLWISGGWEYYDFLSKIFCITVPKNFVGEPFLVSEKFCYRKFSCIRGGGYHDFPLFRRINKVENVVKGGDSNPYLPLQNPVVLPTVPWEHLEFLNFFSEIIKIYSPTEIRTRTYCLRNVCPNPSAEFFWINSWHKYTDEKQMTPLYLMNNFSGIFKYAAKNKNQSHFKFRKITNENFSEGDQNLVCDKWEFLYYANANIRSLRYLGAMI